jgi:hypothetical protein
VDEDGLIKSVDADVARFDHDPVTGECLGLLVEESRQNLWNNSNDFTVWTKQTNNSGVVGIAITNSTTSPDGTLNACRYFVQTAGGTFYSLYRGLAGISSNTSYCYSVFAKAGEISNLGLVVFDNTGTAGVGFNLSTGTVGIPYNNANTTVGAGTTITNYGNGWYRCSIVFSSTLSGNNFQFKIDLSTTTVNQGIFIYGAQFEQGAFPTSYIPTLGSTATRNPDNAYIEGSKFTEFYNSTEGSAVCYFSSPTEYGRTNASPFVFSIDRNTIGWGHYVSSGGASVSLFRNPSGSNVAFLNTGSATGTTDQNRKLSVGYKLNDFAQYLNIGGGNVSQAIDTLGEVRTDINAFAFNPSHSGLQRFGGHIQKFLYYPTKFTNTQLRNLAL